MADKKPEALEKGKYQAQLHFNIPVNMPSVYATNMLIQATDQEIVLSFFEAQPPVIMEGDEQALEVLAKVGVRADCVSRITISAGRFPGFVEIMQDFAKRKHEIDIGGT